MDKPQGAKLDWQGILFGEIAAFQGQRKRQEPQQRAKNRGLRSQRLSNQPEAEVRRDGEREPLDQPYTPG
jgi:hypothetical protein